MEFAVRLEAAEALGQAGDPRIGKGNWVKLGTFQIGRFPLTVGEYKVFVESEGYLNDRWWKAGGFGAETAPRDWEQQLEHPNRPVTGVSWYEAAAYCAWAGVRLPAEAEWDRAARGQSGRKYPSGEAEPDATRANYGGAGPGHATPVGLYPAGATPEGIQDLSGNVWEWVAVWDDDEKKYRVLRGGSWLNVPSYLRAASRLSYHLASRWHRVPCAREVFT